MKDEEGVFDAAGHGTELVEGPAERHCAGARDTAIGGTQAGDATAHAGRDDAAAGFAANGKADEASGGGGTGAGAGARSAFFEQPGIHGLPAEPDVIEREGAEAEFGDEDRAGSVEAFHDGCVLFGDAVAKRFGAVGGGNAGGVEEILAAPGNAVERSAVLAGGDFSVGLLGLLESKVFRQRDNAAEFGIVFLETVKINLREARGGDLLGFDPVRKMGDGREGDSFVTFGKRGSGVAAEEAVLGWSNMHAGQRGIPTGVRNNGGGELDFAGPGAALVHKRDVAAPTGGGLFELRLGQRDLHEFFGFDKRFRRHLWTHALAGAESGRCAGG